MLFGYMFLKILKKRESSQVPSRYRCKRNGWSAIGMETGAGQAQVPGVSQEETRLDTGSLGELETEELREASHMYCKVV